jgi:hypothetical protein
MVWLPVIAVMTKPCGVQGRLKELCIIIMIKRPAVSRAGRKTSWIGNSIPHARPKRIIRQLIVKPEHPLMSLTETPHLLLPYMAPSQAQKHVTHNEALRLLDALVQLSVLSRLTVPPVSPVDGARYLVLPNATGVFAGQAGKIASFVDSQWLFMAPEEGWLSYVAAEGRQYVYSNALWQDHIATAVSAAPVAKLGVNTNADATNKLSVKSDAILFSHDDVTPGTGDMRAVLNKLNTGKTGSLTFQTNFSSRAEMGLMGGDDFSVKISADGATWKDAILINRTTGGVRLPNGLIDVATGQKPALFIPSLVKEIWRSDMNAPATPRTYTIAARSGTTVTIATNEVEQFFNVGMHNVSMVRIWNVSKTPAQAAWVDWNLAANQFRVSNAAHISGWLAGETLRIGDPNPTGTNVLNMVALDISNYMFNTFGTVFRQRGLKFSASIEGVGAKVSFGWSPSGAAGSGLDLQSGPNGDRMSGFIDVFTTELSPVSNSNLLFFREQLNGGTALAATRLMRLVGVWV